MRAPVAQLASTMGYLQRQDPETQSQLNDSVKYAPDETK